MFAGLLNKGFRGSFLLLAIYFLVTALISYLAPTALLHDEYPDVFYNYFTGQLTSKLAIVSLNFLFIGLGTLLVGVISANQEIVDKQNYFPVFLFLALSTVAANPVKLAPHIFTNVFVLYAFYKLLNTYRQEDVLKQVFDAAFLLSVSFFITISGIIFFPIFFIALFILRSFNWREWAVSLLGFLVPVFIYECMAYLSNFTQYYIVKALGIYLQSLRRPTFSEYYLAISVFLFVLLLIAVFYNLARGFGNTVKKQRAKTILLWYLFFCMFSSFSGGANSSSIILTCALPLSFFIGDFLFSLKSIKITNTLITVLLLCALVIILARFELI